MLNIIWLSTYNIITEDSNLFYICKPFFNDHVCSELYY